MATHLKEGLTPLQIAERMGVTLPTIATRMGAIRGFYGILPHKRVDWTEVLKGVEL